MKKIMFATILVVIAQSIFCADLPDPTVTPGAINTAVTQANIKTTICVSGWTKTIRPPASYTNKLKVRQMAGGVYASTQPLNMYEEDHLISLEIGGNPTDARNLWPQHWSPPMGAHQKDQLENYLKKAVCAGGMTLEQAQREVSTDWIATYRKYIKP